MKKYLLAGAALALTLSTAGIAQATPLVTNGDFSQISAATGVDPNTPTQLNYVWSSPNYGEFVTGWTATGAISSQNVIWFPNATAASGTNAEDIDTAIPIIGTPVRPLLPNTVTAPPDGGAFMAMQSNLTKFSLTCLCYVPDSGIAQTINDLTIGQSYTVSFDWAATMDNIDTWPAETSYLTASIDGASLTTPQQTVKSQNGYFEPRYTPTFNGWLSESFDFVADTTSSTLTFLAGGSPASLPPYALLSNVSITPKATPVPEPGSLALLGTALFGLGFIVYYRRRRSA